MTFIRVTVEDGRTVTDYAVDENGRVRIGDHLLQPNVEASNLNIVLLSPAGRKLAELRCFKGSAPQSMISELHDVRGFLVSRARHRDDRYEDGPDGEPAREIFYPNGSTQFQFYYRSGLQQDRPDGRPSMVHFHPNGQVGMIHRHQSGKLQDGTTGEPAVETFDLDGWRTYYAHCQDGEYLDDAETPNPARPEVLPGGVWPSCDLA